MALRAGSVGLWCEAGLGLAGAGRGPLALWGPSPERAGTCLWTALAVGLGCQPGSQVKGVGGPCPSADIQRPAQNWYGPGESDCLIKTKHCDGRHLVLTQCDFCPVL